MVLSGCSLEKCDLLSCGLTYGSSFTLKLSLLQVELVLDLLKNGTLFKVTSWNQDLLQLIVFVNVETVEFLAVMHEGNSSVSEHFRSNEGVATNFRINFTVFYRLEFGPDSS